MRSAIILFFVAGAIPSYILSNLLVLVGYEISTGPSYEGAMVRAVILTAGLTFGLPSVILYAVLYFGQLWWYRRFRELNERSILFSWLIGVVVTSAIFFALGAS